MTRNLRDSHRAISIALQLAYQAKVHQVQGFWAMIKAIIIKNNNSRSIYRLLLQNIFYIGH